ncbi:MAG TPA: AMP-binding protein [Acetobacteraceae bacterium]|nr:AMP-binding protein [Acetobacteraceae bacterium]
MVDGTAPAAQARMADLVHAAAAHYGDALAFVGEDGARLSFRAFGDAAWQAAGAFIAAGVARGDRVAIWAPNCVAWVVAAAGLQIAGAALVPLNTRFKAPEAAYILRKTRARVLLTVGEFLGNDYAAMLTRECGDADAGHIVSGLPSLETIVLLDDANRPGCVRWRDFLAAGGDGAALAARSAEVRPEDTGDILFTSGTTGAPKGAMHSQRQALWMVGVWNRLNDLRPDDRQIIVNPFFHSFGYRSGFVSGLMAGMATWPIAVFDPIAVMGLIAQERITVLMGPPTLFFAILDHPRRAEFDLASLRVAHTGSSNVPVDLIRRLRDELRFDLVLTSYGLTEATALVSANAPDADFETIARSVGAPLPGVELRIDAAEGADSGEILVRGPNVMQGYFEDPAATAEAIDAEGWLHTGDVGRIGADGNLRILDRIKDVVIVGGFNAYPAEIENVLMTHPAVAEVAIVAVPDTRLGEACGAAVVLKPDQTLTLEDLTAWCRERMANYKVPRHLLLLDELPRTALGKPLKYVLRARMGG